MCDFEVVQNNNYSAVFINEENVIPLEIIPLEVYRFIGGIQELCKYVYLFEDSIKYEILNWENREPKDEYALLIMQRSLNEQKSFKNLIKQTIN